LSISPTQQQAERSIEKFDRGICLQEIKNEECDLTAPDAGQSGQEVGDNESKC
jgi:hypothetical protein